MHCGNAYTHNSMWGNQQVHGYLMLQEQLWEIPHSIYRKGSSTRNRETTRDCNRIPWRKTSLQSCVQGTASWKKTSPTSTAAARDDRTWGRRGPGRLAPAPLRSRHRPAGRAARTETAVSQKVKRDTAFCTTPPVPEPCNSGKQAASQPREAETGGECPSLNTGYQTLPPENFPHL